MRLTLRTLLAYLDDVLEPSQTKEIGQKIAESPMATSLAQRIREVMRRRRLSAEDLNETGLDANLVSDYIDGALTPAEIADVERVCLGSDAHLAEVAACHQILTLVLGEPVEIVPASRERMYGLADDGSVTKLGENPAPPPEVAAAATFTPPTSAGSWWRGPIPLIAPLVLVALWLGLLWLERSQNGDNSLASRGPVPINADDDRGTAIEAPAIAPPQDEPEVVADADPKPADLDLDPTPPPDLPERDDTPTQTDKVADSNAKPDPGDTAEPSIAVKPADPPEPVAPAEPLDPFGQYKSSEGVLLQYQQPQAGWFPVSFEARLVESARLAVPEPFLAVIKTADGGPLVQLVGGTMATALAAGEAAQCGMEVRQGRVLLDAPGDDSKPIAIQVESRLWRIEFVDPDTRVGIEVIPLPTYGQGASVPENHFLVQAIVVRGSVRIADDRGESVMVGPRQQLTMLQSDAAAGLPSAPAVPESVLPRNAPPPPTPGVDPVDPAPSAAVLQPQPVALIPEWCVPEEQVRSPILKKYVDEFQAQFDPTLPALENMLPLIRDDRPQMAEYGVKCLALLDHSEGLVKALAYSNHEETRRAAAHGLRLQLPRNPDDWPAIQQQLEIAFPGETAKRIERLLWGFSDADAADLRLSLDVVDWLDDSHVAVRELTIAELERITGQLNFGYRALLSTPQRRSALNRWKHHVEENGGLLPKPE